LQEENEEAIQTTRMALKLKRTAFLEPNIKNFNNPNQ